MSARRYLRSQMRRIDEDQREADHLGIVQRAHARTADELPAPHDRPQSCRHNQPRTPSSATSKKPLHFGLAV